MTTGAAATFWEVARQGRFPAALPIADSEGFTGLATFSFEVTDRAVEFVYSKDKRMRAVAAIHAINDSRRTIKAEGVVRAR